MTGAYYELEQAVRAKRRALLDAIRAIHTGNGMVRVNLHLAEMLERAWAEYDQAIADQTTQCFRQREAARDAVVAAGRQAVGGSMGGYVALREALAALDRAEQAEEDRS